MCLWKEETSNRHGLCTIVSRIVDAFAVYSDRASANETRHGPNVFETASA